MRNGGLGGERQIQAALVESKSIPRMLDERGVHRLSDQAGVAPLILPWSQGKCVEAGDSWPTGSARE